MTYYVYELVDPRTDQAFYVGKGRGRRIDAHEAEARKGGTSPKCSLIREIEASGYSVRKRKVRSFRDEQDAYDFEAELVCAYGLENLTNLVDGGGSASGGPSLYEDRLHVSGTADLISRTGDGSVAQILIAGRVLDLLPILEDAASKCGEIIARRGIDWVNGISRRYAVEFAYG